MSSVLSLDYVVFMYKIVKSCSQYEFLDMKGISKPFELIKFTLILSV